MTQTKQSCSFASFKDADKKLIKNKPEKEDNISLLFSVFESLDELYGALSELSHEMEKKIIEHNLSHNKKKGEKNEN